VATGTTAGQTLCRTVRSLGATGTVDECPIEGHSATPPQTVWSDAYMKDQREGWQALEQFIDPAE
jgi:hypothetical protein